jgi:tripartite-type tricarboxylate transporter receptor subunit TctC
MRITSCKPAAGLLPRAFLTLALSPLLAAIPHAQAQDYPTRAITVVVSQAAGGGNDILARAFAEKMQSHLGKPVLVENRPSAGGMIGAAAVAKAAPDGYTLLLLTNAEVIYQYLHPSVTLNVARDFAPVSLLATAPLILLSSDSLAAKTIPELVGYAKSKPGVLSYGSPGVGTPHHITGEMLKQAAQIDMLHIPYKGTAPSMNDLLAGQIPLVIATAISVMPQLQAGKVHAIATADEKRTAVLPNVPTIQESGYPGFDVASVAGLAAPAGTPPEVIERLNRAVHSAIEVAGFKQRMLDLGYDLVASTADAYRNQIASDDAKYRKLIPALGIATQ